MKTYVTLIAATLIALAAQSQQAPEPWFTIKAFLPQWEQAMVKIDKNDIIIGKGTISNDIFSFTAAVTHPAWAGLHLTKEGRILTVPFFIEPGTITIRARGEYNVYVTGTPLNDAYMKFNRETDLAAAGKNLKQTRSVKRLHAAAFIKENPASLVSLRLLKEFFYLDTAANDSVYFALYDLLDDSLKETVTGRNIRSEAFVRVTTMPGTNAPQVNLKDSGNKQQPLYAKGKVTIVHFRAGWCVPCKQELVLLKKTFEKHAPGGVQVVSVSLEKGFQLWKQSITPSIPGWKHFIDLKGFDGAAAKSYGVKSIPDNFLIGADGKLIGRHLSVGEIDRILSTMRH